MRDKWDKDLPPEGMKANINRRCHISFSRLDCGNSLDYYRVIHFILRTGPGVRVGVGVGAGAGAGVGVDREPGVGDGV